MNKLPNIKWKEEFLITEGMMEDSPSSKAYKNATNDYLLSVRGYMTALIKATQHNAECEGRGPQGG